VEEVHSLGRLEGQFEHQPEWNRRHQLIVQKLVGQSKKVKTHLAKEKRREKKKEKEDRGMS
jgi:hypothetical protein